ncbi:MAG: rhodanese-like domain-containing protein [Bacteroidetes bacterium]|nr:rhodanese-like domain-containing protein [Bacteroidota bacterium]
MKEITVQELKAKSDENQDFQLIDVREPYEYEIVHMGGELIPLGELIDSIDKIKKDKDCIFYCRSGARSAQAVAYLNQQGYDNVYNLRGGILAYATEVDTSMPTY